MFKSTVWRMIRFFARQLADAKRYLIAVMVMLVGTAAIQYAIPRITQSMIDQVIPKKEVGILALSVGALLVLTAVTGLLSAGSNYLLARVSQSAVARLRNTLFGHALNQDFAFFETSKTGDLMVVLTSDVNALQGLLSPNALGLFGSILTAVVVLVIMLIQNPVLTGLIVLTFPILFIVNLFFSRLIHGAWRRVRQSTGTMNNQIQESLASILLIKSMATEDQTTATFAKVNEDNRKNQLAATTYFAEFSPVIDFVDYLGTALIIGVGAYQVMGNSFTVGGIVAYLSYLTILQAPVRSLTNLIDRFQQAVVSYERIENLLAQAPQVVDVPDPQPLPTFHEAVQFDHVDFHYGNGLPVIQDVSFDLPKGETVALVGSSGAGKTTITKLLDRFYDVTAGQITFDGIDIRQVRARDLRRQIGVVTQDVLLLDTSIRDNIAYGLGTVTDDAVWAAAEAANIADFVRSLPDGLNTRVGERGVRLSGGQKQRIAIARIFLQDAPIVVLDEATAALDNETERFIQTSFDRLMTNRTSLVIAHRLSTIQHASEILVVEDGKIVERGTHQELLDKNGRYAQLYALQFK
ncbi:ABC transporter ATP-binding protein [Schleiferilactobacillus perolens]|uniref:ABC transporter ATP-binding protein n=1 Tax=Schleiferilactobacillus perolens TaxID=100468 RepID=UPI0023566E03|nr:ABC transporter ATP-binding protein [Schleiferilactobacillus perolens]MCI2171676.1 ABC transporter ATP-binding protein/permease [Schleiferilactobacillus perolens]